MKEEFVTLEMAKKLKELGFNEYCRSIYVKSPSFIKEIQDKYPGWYFEEIRDELGEEYEKYVVYNYEIMDKVYYRNEDLEESYTCPTIIEVYEWLRYNNVYITTLPSFSVNQNGGHFYKFYISVFNFEKFTSNTYQDDNSYETYEKARFKAIEYILLNEKLWKK